MNYEMHLFTRLAQPLLEGHAWGMGAREGQAPFEAANLNEFSRTHISAALARDLADLNVRKIDTEFVNAVDALVDAHPEIEDLREFLIDLAILQVITGGGEQGTDFLESEEFQQLEDQTEDRGTELLNLLVYLKDCVENEAKPSLNDFLTEFLLVEEDEYQDEFFIYEPVIRHADLLKGNVEAIIGTGNQQKEDMVELFTPMMLFFKKKEDQPGKLVFTLLAESDLPHVHCGVYRLLVKAVDLVKD